MAAKKNVKKKITPKKAVPKKVEPKKAKPKKVMPKKEAGSTIIDNPAKVEAALSDQKMNMYVKEHAHFITDVMVARRDDIHNIFETKRKMVEIKHNANLDEGQKKEALAEQKTKLKQAYADAISSKRTIEKTVSEAIKSKFFDLKVCFSYQQIRYGVYLDELNKLRRDGENKVIALRNEIQDIILNKQIEKNQKKQLIKNNREELAKAREIARINKKEVNAILREAMYYSKTDFKQYFRLIKASNKYDNKNSRTAYQQMADTFEDMHKKRVAQIKEKGSADKQRLLEAIKKEKANPDSSAKLLKLKQELKACKKALAVDLKAERISYSSKINEAKTARDEAFDHSKAVRYNTFMNKYSYTGKLKHDHHPIGEWLSFKYENYISNFNLTNWLIKNALYVVILIVFAALIGMSYTMPGDGLLAGKNILGAIVQISPKIFFALGVAGLILLGGTDLSIGRLTGVGVSFSLMIMSSIPYKDQVTDSQWWIFTDAPIAAKIICALLVSITICTIFTTFAGFFTAKFKMHPFISTLAVQLISYGLFQIFWSATSSFTPDSDILEILRGPSSVLLVVYAAIAIAVVWFIWNKTKFGKHLYAVGGNQEAATVSGINPFTITMLAFVMAGILYGIGGFVQAVQTGTGNFNSGYGTETDAIAACVIGGISFSGGVGKVGGAVIGAIILGFLTYAFAYIGVNSNLQLLIKGVIILVAVALDCVKYLRKK